MVNPKGMPPPPPQPNRPGHGNMTNSVGPTIVGTTTTTTQSEDYLYNLIDHHSILYDTHHRPITIGRILATKPLKSDLLTRPGPGNKKLVYMSGDTITRSLNEIFSYTGWNLQILKTEQVLCVDTKAAATTTTTTAAVNNHKPVPSVLPKHPPTTNTTPMWHVAYLSHVRITLTASGSYREDLGAGDAMDKNLGTAIQHAIKSSITDAMKRAARHFGDKLGNSLYQGTFRMATAPNTLSEALEQYDQQHTIKYKNIHTTSSTAAVTTTATTLPVAAVKVESTTMMPIPSELQPTSHPSTTTSSRTLPIAHLVVGNHDPPTTTAMTSTGTQIMPPPPPNKQYLHNSYANNNIGGNSRTTNHPSPHVMATAVPVTTAPNHTTTSGTHLSMVTPNPPPPPLTAAEHLQSMLCFEKENVVDTTNHHNHNHHNNNNNNHEALVHTKENDPPTTSKPTSVTASTVTSYVHHQNHSSATTVNNTTTNHARPRTSNGRSSNRKSSHSPPNHHDNIDAVPVVAVATKKSKLNPYSTS
jgi:recombination DNA repair RAD52 pathway protein